MRVARDVRRRELLSVLLIEDNEGDAELVRDRLGESAGCDFDITSVPDLDGAISELARHSYDAIIADLRLPGSSPSEILMQIRKTRESVATIVLTGIDDEWLRRESLGAGAQEYLVKSEPAALLIGRRLLAAVERHRAQSAQRQLERWIASTPDAVVVADMSGAVQFVNQAALDLFGRSERELLNETLWFSMKDGASTEIEILRGRDYRACEMRVVAVDWLGAAALMASIRDNTERRKAEAQLAVADRLVSIGTLAASVAHEINNPLAAVLANLELAARSATDDSVSAELRELITDARDAADRVRVIASVLRVFSRASEEQPKAVSIRKVVDTTLRLASHVTRSRAEVVVSIPPDVPCALATEARLGQVILNLLVNAAQAIPPGTHHGSLITISAQRREESWVEIAVTDTGSGMSEHVLRRLFTPFFTSKPAEQGTGLGLGICQRVVNAYGGRIEVESAVGKGSTFRVILPAQNSAPSRTEPATHRTPSTLRGRILIVDDDAVVAQVFARGLRSSHEVHVVHSGLRALELLRRDPGFDVVLCDVTMPGLSGTELYSALLRELPQVARKLVFLSGGGGHPSALEVLHAAPNRRLSKPVNFGELSNLITEMLESGAPGAVGSS